MTRHGSLPGIVLTIAAAGALASLGARIRDPWPMAADWKESRVGMAAAVWSVLIAGLALVDQRPQSGIRESKPVRGLSRDGRLAGPTTSRGGAGARYDRLVALLSVERPGYHFADVYQAPADPATRWVVVRGPHVEGRWHYTAGHS